MSDNNSSRLIGVFRLTQRFPGRSVNVFSLLSVSVTPDTALRYELSVGVNRQGGMRENVHDLGEKVVLPNFAVGNDDHCLEVIANKIRNGDREIVKIEKPIIKSTSDDDQLAWLLVEINACITRSSSDLDALCNSRALRRFRRQP